MFGFEYTDVDEWKLSLLKDIFDVDVLYMVVKTPHQFRIHYLKEW